jgi:CheY-like chemotaxis protein
MKILVVHRQHSTVDHIKLVLRSYNPVVLYAESGLDGLLTSRIEHFDLIICSTDLPVVTGFELVRSIRNSAINQKTPVVFLSDSEKRDEKSLQLARSLGAISILSKDEVEFSLADIIVEQVSISVDKPWTDLKVQLAKD